MSDELLEALVTCLSEMQCIDLHTVSNYYCQLHRNVYCKLHYRLKMMIITVCTWLDFMPSYSNTTLIFSLKCEALTMALECEALALHYEALALSTSGLEYLWPWPCIAWPWP